MVKKKKATRWQRITVNRRILLSNPITMSPGALYLMLQVWLAHTPKLLILIQGYLLFKAWFTGMSFESKFFTFLSFTISATLK